MPAVPILGIGSKISVNRGSGYVDIVKLVEIGEFGLEGDDVEVTNHDSLGGVREYIRGLTDPSEIAFTGVWVADATQIALMTDVLTGMTQPNLPYRITLAQGYGQFDFSGYLKAFTINPQLDDRMECNGTIKMASIPTFAVTAAAGLTTPFFVLSPAGVNIPAPAQNTLRYVNEQVTGTSAVTVTPTAAVGTITVNGTTVATGVASGSIALGAAGSITRIVIVVSETGKAPKEYWIDVARA